METSAGPSPNERIGFRTIWLIFVACVAVSMVIAAMASLNTAIPEIAPAVQANSNQVTWLIDGYTLTLAAMLLPAGAIGDRFGRREVLVGGLMVFALGSLLPIWISDPTQFIATRCLTGIGAAFVMPATLSLITSGVPDSKRPLAVSIWAGVAGAGGIAGFFVTGVLLEFFSWHSIFLTFAIAASVTAVLSCTVPTSQDPTSPRFDWWGSVTSALAVALLVFALIESPHRGWVDPLTLTAFAIGIGLVAVFWYSQLHRSEPLLDVMLFGNRAFAAGSFSVMMQFMVAFGMFLVLLQHLQSVFGYSPLKSAIALFPMVIVVMVCSLIGNWIAVKVNLRIILAAGVFVMGVGLLLLGAIHHSEYWTIAVCLVVFALGLGIGTAPATTAIMVNTPANNQGVGSAINDTSRELGSAIGIAVAGSLLASGYTRNVTPIAGAARTQLEQTAAQLDAAGQPVQSQEVSNAAGAITDHITNTVAEALQIAARLAPGQPELASRITEGAKDAFIGPVNTAYITLGVLSIVGAVLLAAFAPSRMESAAAPDKCTSDDRS